MKLYIVERDEDKVDYDEFDSVMVWANNMPEALQEAVDFYHYFNDKKTTVTAIPKPSKSKIVHASFCAG